MPEPAARGALGELTEILTTLTSFSDDPTRGVIIDELGPRIAAQIPRYPVARMEALAIVQACLRIPGGLTSLADVLEVFEGGTPAVERFRRLVHALSLPPELQDTERRQLVSILDSVEGRPWLAAYLGAASPVVERLPDGPGEALAVLEDLPAPRGEESRVLRFTRRLVVGDRLPEQARAAVHRWHTMLAGRLGLPLPPPPDHEPRGPATEDALLVLSLEPYLPGDNSCLLSAWLGYDQDAWLPLVREDRPRPLSEIPSMLDEFMHVVRDFTGGHPPQRVEFMLPRLLLSLPVDQWVTNGQPSVARRPGATLGTDCAVVVRDLERATDPSAREQWSRRWRAFDRADVLSEREVLWLNPGRSPYAYDSPAVPYSACAAVVEPPEGEDRSRLGTADALGAVLDAGVPVAVWSRQTGPAHRTPRGAFQRFARELFHRGRSDQLPERMRSLRSEASETTELDWARHIALLWDDPTRTVGAGTALRWP
ncbi:effector-associated domain 2-containing protein [Streptomyces adustus]|uniref:VMAP-C domain-containing protein n=1 Tax=Streptomyces adustus TaxID=1609272 RepID=UPI0023681DCF|nr:hypothetical protein [Streptomyces adustus]